MLRLQRRAGNQAVARTLSRARGRQLQRFTDEELQKTIEVSKLTPAQVQVVLEVGEATGLFPEVYEAATSRFNLNPEGLYTMLGSLRAIVKEKKPSTSSPSSAPPRGASGFVRELLYGLQHMRSERHVQFGAMRPDDLLAALTTAGLNEDAKRVKEDSRSVPLGQQLGGDVVVWGSGKSEEGVAQETVQHKVVDGEKESAVADELRNAIHQLTGKNKELAVPGLRRTADIVVLATNELAKAEPKRFVEMIEQRLKESLGGTLVAELVDLVRISAVSCQVEYDVKTKATRVVEFSSDLSAESPAQTLSDKTPQEWNDKAIKLPVSLVPKPKVVERKLAELSVPEIAERVGEIESAMPFEAMNKSDALQVVEKLKRIKKEWLQTKTASLTKQKERLNEEREEWVTSQLSSEKAPEGKDTKVLKEWSQRQKLKGNDFRQQWNEKHKKQTDLLDDEIGQVEPRILEKDDEDGKLLKRLNTGIDKHQRLADDIASYDRAAKERNEWVSKTAGKDKTLETKRKLEEQWDDENPEKAQLVAKNQKYAKMNLESIERDRKAKQQKLEVRRLQEEAARRTCGPLLDAVERVLPNSVGDLMTSLIDVLDHARHAAGVGTLCGKLAAQIERAHKHATRETPAIDPAGLNRFVKTLTTHREYVNLQGDLAEISQATQMAESGSRIGPVVIGDESYDKRASSKDKPQEIDVSFSAKEEEQEILHLQEVAWDLATLELKLLHPDKQSQREGYARVIKAQQDGKREVRMTYVVHNVTPGDLTAIQTNTAPGQLGADVADLVKTGESGAMKTVLVKRGYYLSLGGKVYAPGEL